MEASEAHFDDWDGHWTRYATSAEVNPAQAYRRHLIRDFLAADGCRPPERIVDLGSGQGDQAAELIRAFPGARVLGVELSAAGVSIASSKVPEAQFLRQNLLEEVDENGPYRAWADHAVCSEVLEHLDDPALFLKNSTAFMKPGCLLIVTVPGGPMSAFDRHIGHRKHYSVAELRRVLESAGFEVIRVEAAGYPFFNLYRRTVILRGDALIRDLSNRPRPLARLASRAVMATFRLLFRLNRNTGSHGWQMVAAAQYGTSRSGVLSGSSSQMLRPAK